MKNLKMKDESQKTRPLLVWPGIAIVMIQWFVRFILPEINPDVMIFGVIGGVVGGILLLIWWAFFSRARLLDRWLAVVIIIVSMLVTSQLLDKSIATSMMGMMYPMVSIPLISLAFVIWAVISRYFSFKHKRIIMVAVIVLSSGFWVLLRSNGMNGETHHDLAWRWSKSAEDRLLSKGADKMEDSSNVSQVAATEAEWPGFRGKHRDGIVNGVRILTDWMKNPPSELWRKSIGPGCSSFAVQGDRLFTQEQRGEYEMVSCYNLKSGAPLWMHKDSTRFWDSHAGAGPRSTPTIDQSKIYTLGATGILNALNATDGTLIWSRNASKDTKVILPGWGYCSSPLVVDSIVFVAISGELLAYNKGTGKLEWAGADGGDSYSSPQLMTLNGVQQIVFTNRTYINSYSLKDWSILWSLPCESEPIVQPSQLNETDILINAGGLKEMQRLTIENKNSKWKAIQRWKSELLKPYFNDNIVYKDFVYGFEGPILTCINCKDGTRMWKGGRYAGEMLLLADQGLLLILTEKGELALVEANPEQFKEVARIPVLKGRTWNHPAMAGNILIVRNDVEMAAYRLN
jgi:outer membrane protein assembly factor BamB